MLGNEARDKHALECAQRCMCVLRTTTRQAASKQAQFSWHCLFAIVMLLPGGLAQARVAEHSRWCVTRCVWAKLARRKAPFDDMLPWDRCPLHVRRVHASGVALTGSGRSPGSQAVLCTLSHTQAPHNTRHSVLSLAGFVGLVRVHCSLY